MHNEHFSSIATRRYPWYFHLDVKWRETRRLRSHPCTTRDLFTNGLWKRSRCWKATNCLPQSKLIGENFVGESDENFPKWQTIFPYEIFLRVIKFYSSDEYFSLTKIFTDKNFLDEVFPDKVLTSLEKISSPFKVL